MNNIQNVENFKSFKFSEIFELVRGESENISSYIDGGTPLISATEKNNGVTKFVTISKSDKVFQNCITVANNGSVGEAFYQKEDFIATSDVTILKLKDYELNEYVAMYLISLIKKHKNKFNFNEKWSLSIMRNSIIKLPMKDNQIDFDYMEQYIIKIKEKVNKALILFDKINNLKEKVIDTTNWKEFRVGDLFDIDTGSSIPRSQLANGNIPRISVKGTNNGITGYFDTSKLDNARHYENFISVSFLGDVFYHPYTASCEMKVHSLKLKNHAFTEATGLYMATIIKKAIISAYSYVDQLSSSKLKKDKIFIKLPINKDNQIDFDYIENYVLKTQNKVQNHLNNLISL